MRIYLSVAVTIFLLLNGFTVKAEEIIMIESTITGSQEQPKVISIVPWKGTKDPDYIGEDIIGLGEPLNVFQSLDRPSFNRERLYIGATRKSPQRHMSAK